MAASSKEALSELMENLERAAALDPKWRKTAPETKDFGLDGVNIAGILNRREAHMENREKKAEEIKRSIPPELSWSYISFGWEVWAMIILCIATFVYYKIVRVPSHTASVVVSVLSFGIVLLYFVRAIRAKNRRKREIKDLQEYRLAVLREPFEDEDKYELIRDYAKALSDHALWQEIVKASHWKEISAADARREIFAIYETAGFEPDGTYDEYVDFLAEEDGKKAAVACPGGKKVTARFAEGFVAETEDEAVESSTVYAFGNVESGAREVFEAAGVKLAGVDDLLKLVNKICED